MSGTQPQVPGPKGHWLLGSTLEFAAGTLAFVQRCMQEYPGGVVKTRIAFRDFYLLLKPEYISHVLQTNQRNYRKSFAYDGLKTFLGQGLLTSEGDFWLRQRRLAQPAFHRAQLNQLLQQMEDSAAKHIAGWQPNHEIDIGVEMGQLSQDIISHAVFGATAKALPEVNRIGELLPILRNYANDRMKKPFMPPLWVPTGYNRRFRGAVQSLRDIVLEAIRLRRDAPPEDAALLGMLMQAHTQFPDENAAAVASDSAMTDAQLYDEIVTIFIAGQETTTNAMGFLFHLLARHPEIMAKVRAEVMALSTGKEEGGPSVYQLPYTWQVVREALRLYPPAWAVSREAIASDEIGGATIPKGATVFLSIYAMHRHPDHWEAPDEFRPERFADESYPKHAYLPFGAGPRKCIGSHFALLEMVVILRAVASRIDLELVSSTELQLATPMTMGVKVPIRFRVRPLENG